MARLKYLVIPVHCSPSVIISKEKELVLLMALVGIDVISDFRSHVIYPELINGK